jgi:hypothetical protein
MQSDNNASCTTEDEMFYQRIGKLTIGKLRTFLLSQKSLKIPKG